MRMITSRRIKWAGDVIRIGEDRNAHKVLERKS
jgi:hypothetical protein